MLESNWFISLGRGEHKKYLSTYIFSEVEISQIYHHHHHRPARSRRVGHQYQRSQMPECIDLGIFVVRFKTHRVSLLFETVFEGTKKHESSKNQEKPVSQLIFYWNLVTLLVELSWYRFQPFRKMVQLYWHMSRFPF